jgi:hypothetical protein
MYDDKSGKLKINKGKTGSILYDYELVSGSSFAVDEQKQLENLQAIFAWLSNPQVGPYVEQRLQQEGTKLNFTKLLTGIVSKNIDNWDDIVQTQDVDSPGAQQDEQVLQQHQDEFAMAVQQMQQGMGQDISQIPPQYSDDAIMGQQQEQLGQAIQQMQGQ